MRLLLFSLLKRAEREREREREDGKCSCLCSFLSPSLYPMSSSVNHATVTKCARVIFVPHIWSGMEKQVKVKRHTYSHTDTSSHPHPHEREGERVACVPVFSLLFMRFFLIAASTLPLTLLYFESSNLTEPK